MKKISVLISFCILSQIILFANDNLSKRDIAYEKQYLQEIRKDEFSPEILKLLVSDKKYNLAILQLTNQEYMKDNEILTGDPHNQSSQKKVKVKVPNFKKAYGNLLSSYSETKNPVSAYILQQLIITVFSKNTKLEDYAKYSKINYQNKVCSGYLGYGESLQNGYFMPVDKKMALQVYKEGYEECKDNSWIGSVLMSKINSIR